MTIHERSRRLSGLLAACFALLAAPAAAQDPPPPLLPSDTPPPAPPAPPAPAPGPDAPPPAIPGDEPPPLPAQALPVAPLAVPPPAEPVPVPSGREPKRGASARTLKGHVFPTPFLVDTAFVTTHFGLGAEIGHQSVYGVLTSPFTNAMGVGTQSYQFDASVGVANLYASLGVAVSDRVEIGADASYSSLLGSDVNTAILYGGQYAWTLRPGVRFRLLRSTSSGTEIGLHLYGNFSSGTIQNPQAVVREIANELSTIAGNNNNQIACLGTGQLSCVFVPGFNPQSAVSTTNTVAGAGATFALAQAVSSNFGLQFALGAELGRGWNDYAGNEIASTPFVFHVGVAPSYSFGPVVPITIRAEYLFTVDVVATQGVTSTMSETTADAGTITTIQHGLVGGVYFTGKSDLQLGALFTAGFTQSAQSLSNSDGSGTDTVAQAPTTTLTGQINARYFF
jgi:hypothetical protein